MSPHDIEQFIQDAKTHGLSPEQCGAALMAHIDAEPPEEQQRSFFNTTLMLALERSIEVGNGRPDAAELARAIQEYSGASQVQVQEFPPVAVFSETVACPVCHTELYGAVAEHVKQRAPKAGDIGICHHCGAALVFSSTGFRLATTNDMARMRPLDRRSFWKAIKDARDNLRRHGIPPATGPF